MTVKPPGSARPIPIGNFMMRRVFLQGGKFICGICRKAYSSSDEANNCLHHCWSQVLQQAPWTATKRMGKTEYHCIYCQRAYETKESAANCAADCAEKMTITSHEAGNKLGQRAKRTFGPKPPVKISLKVPYKISKSTPEAPAAESPHTEKQPEQQLDSGTTAHESHSTTDAKENNQSPSETKIDSSHIEEKKH